MASLSNSHHFPFNDAPQSFLRQSIVIRVSKTHVWDYGDYSSTLVLRMMDLKRQIMKYNVNSSIAIGHLACVKNGNVMTVSSKWTIEKNIEKSTSFWSGTDPGMKQLNWKCGTKLGQLFVLFLEGTTSRAKKSGLIIGNTSFHYFPIGENYWSVQVLSDWRWCSVLSLSYQYYLITGHKSLFSILSPLSHFSQFFIRDPQLRFERLSWVLTVLGEKNF